VIEHDVWVRTDLVVHLAGVGYSVGHASNGFSGLRLACEELPDVIVLGANLPEIASDELRELLTEHPGTRRIHVVSLPIQDTARLEVPSVDVHETRRSRRQ
jgi:CheY-like chemotaxis protein